MTNIAVVKPDHLGDLILTLPALKAIHQKFGVFDLYTASGNRFVADYFLPDIPFHAMNCAHLQKDGGGISMDECSRKLEHYPFIFFLRNDGYIYNLYLKHSTHALITSSDNTCHETLIQKKAIRSTVGDYSRTDLFFPQHFMMWPEQINCVGICVSAGFFTNKLPLTTWLTFSTVLRERYQVSVKFIGGPQEKDELQFIQKMLKLENKDIIFGNSDLTSFFSNLAPCDVIVGNDSGSMHLLSTHFPVMGIFTSSPRQRYAPFGKHNRILYIDIPCSPCVQFSHNCLNGCLSRECGAQITADDIATALFATNLNTITFSQNNLYCRNGVSHIE